MNLDGITLHCITNELADILKGGQISKIYQLDARSLYFRVFNDTGIHTWSSPWTIRRACMSPIRCRRRRTFRQGFACSCANTMKMAASPPLPSCIWTGSSKSPSTSSTCRAAW